MNTRILMFGPRDIDVPKVSRASLCQPMSMVYWLMCDGAQATNWVFDFSSFLFACCIHSILVQIYG